MGIQINGQTDTISALDGGLAVSGYELTGASNINVTGIVTATTFNGDVRVATGSTISGGTNYITASTNGSERFRVESDGDVLLGTGSNHAYIRGYAPTTGDMTIGADQGATGTGGSNLIFRSRGGEKMRITSNGYLKASNTGSYNDVSAPYHETRSDQPDWAVHVTNTHGSNPYGVLVSHSTVKNNTGNWFFYAQESASLRFQVRSNGGIANYSDNNSNLCDEREKKNIETLDSTWSCLKNWELKKFHYNEDADTDEKRYGVIAQQIAEHCPEVITDWVKQEAKDAVLDEDGNVVTPAQEEIVRMGVKERGMYWMAIKALQEAQTRIETLEAEVASLKGA